MQSGEGRLEYQPVKGPAVENAGEEVPMNGFAIRLWSCIFVMLVMAGGAVVAAAETMSYADAVEQLAIACRADLAKYCRGVEFGGGKLKGCLDANAARVSPQCQQTRMTVYASNARRSQAQQTKSDICDADIARLCGTSHADAHLVECLVSISPVAISPACNQVFTDTGWRTERAQQ